MENQVKRALIFVPEEQPIDDRVAGGWVVRRGYKLVALLRKWRFVEEMLARGEANVVVFGGVRDPGGETTRDLSQMNRAGIWDSAADTQRLAPARRGWNAERLAQVIDGDGPVPQGLDPETIAAARRIARALNRRNTA